MTTQDELLKGLKSVKMVPASEMDKFRKEMTERVIPEIKKVVEERKILAAESRHRKIEVLRKPEKKK